MSESELATRIQNAQELAAELAGLAHGTQYQAVVQVFQNAVQAVARCGGGLHRRAQVAAFQKAVRTGASATARR